MQVQLALASGSQLATRLSLAAEAIERAFPPADAPSRQFVDELRQNDERTRFALGAARAGVWEADLETGRVFWSETMHLVMGRSVEAFGGTTTDMLDVVHPADRQLVAPAFRIQGNEPRDFEIEVRVTWPDGSAHGVQLRGRVVQGSFRRGAHVLGVAQDITERQSLERELRQSQKMEAMGRLAGGVAHDFNNVLTAILGYAVLIEGDPIDETETRAHAAQIRRAAERAAGLTRQLLAFSRRQVVEHRPLQLSAVVDDVIPMVSRLLGEHIALTRDFDPVLHPVLADTGQLEQIIMNLSINARDAMPLGGRLTIATSNVTVAGAGVNSRPALKPGPYATLTVTDTGCGMDAATCARVFEPFFTTKAVGVGTGLGLSTVYEIVNGMGGGVSVSSEPGVGTSFCVYLPICRPASAEAATVDAKPATLKGHERILLVEDEEAVRRLVTQFLERNGYSVLQAADPQQARAVVAAADRPIDLVLADVMMPDGTGPDLVASLAVGGVKPRALYMSGYASSALAKEGRLDPSSQFVQKPFSARQILTKIREIFDTKE